MTCGRSRLARRHRQRRRATISASGLRALLLARGEALPAQGLRAMVPMNVRMASEQLALGNKISSLFLELPVAEPSTLERYFEIVARSSALKSDGQQAAGTSAVIELAGLAPPVIHSDDRTGALRHAAVQRHDHQRARAPADAVRVRRAAARGPSARAARRRARRRRRHRQLRRQRLLRRRRRPRRRADLDVMLERWRLRARAAARGSDGRRRPARARLAPAPAGQRRRRRGGPRARSNGRRGDEAQAGSRNAPRRRISARRGASGVAAVQQRAASRSMS